MKTRTIPAGPLKTIYVSPSSLSAGQPAILVKVGDQVHPCAGIEPALLSFRQDPSRDRIRVWAETTEELILHLELTDGP